MSLCIDESLPPGLQHLTLVGCPNRVANIAGLPVVHGDVATAPLTRGDTVVTTPLTRGGDAPFQLNVVGVDHVVVLADDVRATCSEITRVSGAELKRLKESERGIQGFHRWGSVILEVVERRLVQPRAVASDATYWGFVLVVNDIATVCAHLGPDVIGAPKPAVQPGRLIATVRSGAGLGVPLALMSH
ncbi:MAG: hypothetical protein ACO31U_06660 [Ilumatobacteraceae bacterium]